MLITSAHLVYGTIFQFYMQKSLIMQRMPMLANGTSVDV